MIICGIDYSINCPALCFIGKKEVYWCVNYRKDSKSDYSQLSNPNIELCRSYTEDPIERYMELSRWANKRIAFHQPDKVVLEDYAFGANGRLTQLSENVGIFKADFRRNFIRTPLHVVAPTKMKKMATGKGTSDKNLIWESFIKVFPESVSWPSIMFPKAKNIQSPLADIADSYFLAKYGETCI